MRNELLNLLNELLICYFLIIFCGFKNWPVINTGLIEKNEKLQRIPFRNRSLKKKKRNRSISQLVE